MVEVSLPIFPHTVLYMDALYEDIKGDYIYPEHLVKWYRNDVSVVASPLEEHPQVFDKLFEQNTKERVTVRGH